MKIISTIGYVVGLTMAAVDVDCMSRYQFPFNPQDACAFPSEAVQVLFPLAFRGTSVLYGILHPPRLPQNFNV